MKVLTEIGSDDFGQLETPPPQIFTAPQPPAAFQSCCLAPRKARYIISLNQKTAKISCATATVPHRPHAG
ncbi:MULTISPECIES: hypothetical protein [unclassified Microcoleus]|uniref:hypothetical protein n=1 Tax=unclassified Microcoleus TaxID=2642155 RepID=UPI0025D9EBED|nr:MULTISPECIES: hypothetical protein [unclassified Microcoleus]